MAFMASVSSLAIALIVTLLSPCHAAGPRQLLAANLLAASVDVNPDAAPASTFTTNLAACGTEIRGWEKHNNTFPVGQWESFFADSAAACAASCAANSYRCAAVIWEDAKVLPYSDDAKCQFVSELRGFVPGMPAGVDLYTPCHAGCGAVVAGYELHKSTLPVGVWEAFFAADAAGCAESCTAFSDRCIASIWEDAQVLPLSDDAKCQFVSKLTGYTPDVSEGVDLYVRC